MTATEMLGRDAVRSFAEHEHEEVRAGLDRLADVGVDFPNIPVDQRIPTVHRVLEWFDTVLRPHMVWEESWLFPQVDDRARTLWATRIVRYDHEQIVAKAERLRAHAVDAIPSGMTAIVVVDLAGLEALIRANIEREERFLLPELTREVERWIPTR